MFHYFLAEKPEYTKAIEQFGQNRQRNVSRIMLGTYALLNTLTMIMLVLSSLKEPGTLEPYVSLINQNPLEAPKGIKILTLVLFGFSTSMIGQTVSIFEMMLFSFSYFLKHGLRVLSNNTRYKEFVTGMKLADSEVGVVEVRKLLKFNIKQYQDLELLMHEFNQTFSFLVIVLKAFALLNIYIFAYTAVTFEDRSRIVVYAIVSAIHIIRTSIMILVTGEVFQESLNFKNSWKSSLEIMSEPEIQELGFVEPFGFKAYFYTIKPQTILTFFSVLTSHVIVVLQVFNN